MIVAGRERSDDLVANGLIVEGPSCFLEFESKEFDGFYVSSNGILWQILVIKELLLKVLSPFDRVLLVFICE